MCAFILFQINTQVLRALRALSFNLAIRALCRVCRMEPLQQARLVEALPARLASHIGNGIFLVRELQAKGALHLRSHLIHTRLVSARQRYSEDELDIAPGQHVRVPASFGQVALPSITECVDIAADPMELTL